MKTLRWIVIGAGILILLVGLILLLNVSGMRVLDRLWTVPKSPPVDFEHLRRTGKPNDFLVCPGEACPAPIDVVAPRFPVPASELAKAWAETMLLQPRLVRTLGGEGDLQQEFTQRTAWIGFPDSVAVRFIDLPAGGSTLCLYSRSHYGYSDLGTNERRVRSWLRELQTRLP